MASELTIGGTMRDLSQISFDEFLETMISLDAFATESIEEFMQFFFDTCTKCRLVGEMFVFLRSLKKKDSDEEFQLAMEHHKVIMTIWILLNGPDKFKDSIH
jgi:hypothetical protein